jgi:raffinose/stachyose/melibiose transport system substrate-binding protein
MKFKKSLSVLMVSALTLTLAACGNESAKNDTASNSSGNSSSGNEQKKVTIIITNNKGEIASQFDQATKDFMAANPDITVKFHSGAVGDTLSVFDKLTTSGEVITVAMMEPGDALNKYKGFGIDLSNEQWVADTDSAFKDETGTIIGFPFAVEGFGLVYNKKVVENAVGGTFDPFSINTRDKLKELLDKIKASGIQYPVAYQTEDWSVGNHYSSMFLNQSEDINSIVTELKAGSFDLANNTAWNGYYDTMDLLASPEYNKYGERPVGQYYDDAHLSVGKGESAILFNGNWAFDSLKAVAGDDFGFIPVPNDNNPDNPLNNKLAVGPTQLLLINNKATAEQQEAGKKFLDWLVYDQSGQDFVVNEAQIISGFKNNPNQVTNTLGIAIADAIKQGITMPFTTNYIIGNDYMKILGPDIQKYIAKKIDRATLAKAIETYYMGSN